LEEDDQGKKVVVEVFTEIKIPMKTMLFLWFVISNKALK
jgi:hypothetical protein